MNTAMFVWFLILKSTSYGGIMIEPISFSTQAECLIAAKYVDDNVSTIYGYCVPGPKP